jgi:hypothetical protein
VQVLVTEQRLGRTDEPTLRDLSEALIAVYGTDYGIRSPTWISTFTDMARQAAAYRDRRVLLAGLVLADLIVAHLVAGAALTVAVDDTLLHRSGKKVHAACWCHDGFAKGPKKIAWANNWVIAGLVVDLPFMTRPACLPVLFRLYKPKGVTKLVLARQLIDMLACRLPDRRIHVVADAAYATRELRGLPARVTVTCWLRRNAVLYDLAPPRTGKRGRPHQRQTAGHPRRPGRQSELGQDRRHPLRP